MFLCNLPCFCGDLQAILFTMNESIRFLREENRGLREQNRILENRLDTLIPRSACSLRGGLGESRWRNHNYRRDTTRPTYADDMVRGWLGVPPLPHTRGNRGPGGGRVFEGNLERGGGRGV